MTERQLKNISSSNLTGEAECVAKGFIMAKSDPPFAEKKFIDDIIGYGVFATQNLKRGEFVLEYQGELITQEEAKKREKQYDLENAGSFIVYFRDANGKNLCVDATREEGLGRFVNDSCDKEKNCFLKEVISEDTSHICLFASRGIAEGEEIRFDYGVPNLPWRNDRTPSKGCGTCQGCRIKVNCRTCKACLNMKRYGGPGTMKKKCFKKNCLNMSSSGSNKTSSQVRKNRDFEVVSASQPAGSDGMVEVCATSSTSQPLVNMKGMNGREEVWSETNVPKSVKQKRKRPASEKLQKAKKRRRSYCAVTPRKARSFNAKNKIFKSPNKLTHSPASSTDPRTKVYNFGNGDSTSLNLDNETPESNIIDSCEAAPSQAKHLNTDDLDIAWFEGEGTADAIADDMEENVQVCTQNDMSYLTQTRYRADIRKVMMKALCLKPVSKSLDDVKKCDVLDVMNSTGRKQYKSSKKKVVRTELFGKENVDLNNKFEGSKSKVEGNEDAFSDEEKMEDIRNNENTNTGAQEDEGKEEGKIKKVKKKGKLSWIAHVDGNCDFAVNQRQNSPPDISDSLSYNKGNSEDSGPNLCSVVEGEPSAATDMVTEIIEDYRLSLADILNFLEEVAADKSNNARRKKIAKKMKQKKAKVHELLMKISLMSPGHDETMEAKDLNESSMYPSQRKLGGQQAALMLKNLYKTLIPQTVECFQERLDETSFEIKVTFKKDGEENGELEESQKQSEEELESTDSFDTKPETWKDISVVVKYTRENPTEKASYYMKTKETLEDTLSFLETKIQQLKAGDREVHKILKKTRKKIRKKMSEVFQLT